MAHESSNQRLIMVFLYTFSCYVCCAYFSGVLAAFRGVQTFARWRRNVGNLSSSIKANLLAVYYHVYDFYNCQPLTFIMVLRAYILTALRAYATRRPLKKAKLEPGILRKSDSVSKPINNISLIFSPRMNRTSLSLHRAFTLYYLRLLLYFASNHTVVNFYIFLS